GHTVLARPTCCVYFAPLPHSINGVMRRRITLTRLSDHFGNYELRIACRKCAHVRVTDPQVLARIVGWETDLPALAARLRCSRCGEKDVDLSAVIEQRPRGVPKNPH